MDEQAAFAGLARVPVKRAVGRAADRHCRAGGAIGVLTLGPAALLIAAAGGRSHVRIRAVAALQRVRRRHRILGTSVNICFRHDVSEEPGTACPLLEVRDIVIDRRRDTRAVAGIAARGSAAEDPVRRARYTESKRADFHAIDTASLGDAVIIEARGSSVPTQINASPVVAGLVGEAAVVLLIGSVWPAADERLVRRAGHGQAVSRLADFIFTARVIAGAAVPKVRLEIGTHADPGGITAAALAVFAAFAVTAQRRPPGGLFGAVVATLPAMAGVLVEVNAERIRPARLVDVAARLFTTAAETHREA
jgi:hypothetical protein